MLEQLSLDRRALHRIPELGFDLPKTRDYLLNALAATGAKVRTVAENGVLAYFDGGKPQTVAFRADMDALPIRERSGLPFASQHEGRMHACGHDGHMAMLLAFARHADQHIAESPNNVLCIFQPSEETGGGAGRVVESGALEEYRVKRIFALHVAPEFPLGALAGRPNEFFAASTETHVYFHGKAAHVAHAQEGVDALEPAAAFLLRALAMERALPPGKRRLLKFGQMEAGTVCNIVASEAHLAGTARAYDEDLLEEMKARIVQIADDCAALTGARAEVEFHPGYPPVLNDPALYAMAKGALAGLPFIEMDEPSLLGEDFSFYQKCVPGLLLKLGLGTGIALHSPDFVLDERALPIGAEAFVRLSKLP